MFGFGKPKREKVAEPTLQSRQRVLWIHPTSLVSFMKSLRWVIVNNHLPADAQFHHAFYDPNRQVYGIVCISADWSPVFAGDPIPELPPIEFKYFDPALHGNQPPDQRPPQELAKAEGGA